MTRDDSRTERLTDALFQDEEELNAAAPRHGLARSHKWKPEIEVIPILPSDQQDVPFFPEEVNAKRPVQVRQAQARSGIEPTGPQSAIRNTAGQSRRSIRINRVAGAALSFVVVAVLVGMLRHTASGSRPVPVSHPDVFVPQPTSSQSLGTPGTAASKEPPVPASVLDTRTPNEASLSASGGIERPPAEREQGAPQSVAAGSYADSVASGSLFVKSDPAAEMPPVVALPETPVGDTIGPPRPPVALPSGEGMALRSPAAGPPEPVAPPRPSITSQPVDETAAVRVALSRYVNGYSDLDASAVSAVWPSVDRVGLTKAFSALDAQQITFERCDIQVSGATGRATCVGTGMWLPKVGGKWHEQSRTWKFVLQSAAAGWQIVTAEVR